MATILDLHIHSTMSDGVLNGKQIIDKAKENKVKYISITDHDTIDIYSKDLLDYAKKNGIKIIPGVEISTKFKKTSIHVLGYNVDINNENLKIELKKLRLSRQKYLEDVNKELMKLDIKVNLDKLSNIEGVTKAHIAEDVVSNYENKKILTKMYGYIPQKGEFIETVMNPGCPAFVEKDTLSPLEASNLIKSSGGKAVLAHPVVYNSKDNMSIEDLEALLIEMKADGVESYYIYINKNNEVIDDINKWNELSKKLNLFSTIGSDYHASDDLFPEIGFQNYEDMNKFDIEYIINDIYS